MAKKVEPQDEPKPDDTVFVQLMVTSIKPDRTQYKQYGIELVPMKLAVSVPVPMTELTIIPQLNEAGEETDIPAYYVISLNGLGILTKQVADMIDTIHNQHLLDLQKGLR